MPLDEEVKRELDELRDELAELRNARSAGERENVRSEIRETRADLNSVLRREGYRLSQRELDELVNARDEARLEAKLVALLDAREAAAAEAEDDDEDGDGDGDDGEKKKKPPAKRKPAGSRSGGGSAGADETEEEWVG